MARHKWSNEFVIVSPSVSFRKWIRWRLVPFGCTNVWKIKRKIEAAPPLWQCKTRRLFSSSTICRRVRKGGNGRHPRSTGWRASRRRRRRPITRHTRAPYRESVDKRDSVAREPRRHLGNTLTHRHEGTVKLYLSILYLHNDLSWQNMSKHCSVLKPY